ncbi:MAG: DUF302 domain-containing protein [Gemmobacter sp.]
MPRIRFATAALLVALAGPSAAHEFVVRSTDESFGDVAFAVESAIVNRGLVIDLVSHVGDMLERTRADVGGGETLFEAADIFLFCSATLSRAAMEARPENLQHCPYGIHVFQRAGEASVSVGYVRRDDPGMEQVNALLESIVAEVLGD